MSTSISKQEWRWVFVWTALIMLITVLPYLYGLSLSPPGQRFSGFFLGIEDANSYLAKMRIGAEGGWLFHLPYTPEPHDGAYIYTFYLLLGKIDHFVHLSPILVYHLARLAFGGGLLLTVYYFIAYFVDDIAQRRFAFLLAAIGSGLGWILIILGLTPILGLPLDVYVPEGFIFLVLLNLPHLALAESLLFISILFTLRSWQTNTWQPVIWSGVALLMMSLITAFYLAIFAAVWGTVWLVWGFMEKSVQKSWALLVKIIVPVAITTPILLYQAYIFMTNPIFRAWGQQNIILSPPIWHYLFAYGLLIIPAIYSLRQLWATYPNIKILILVVWCVIFPILVYIPFNLQRRLVAGVQVPLVILATYGLFALFRTYLPARGQRLVRVGTLLFFSLTNILLLAGGLVTLVGQQAPLFQPTANIEATQWLATQSKGDVVLATYETGNVLPVYANVRSFVGHGPETVNSAEKREQANRFFDSRVDDAWRIDLLRQFNVAFVFYGPSEQTAGDFAPAQAFYLEKIYDNGTVQIFRVVLP